MEMEFVYPSEMFNSKKADSSYEQEFNIVSKKFKTHLIDVDNLEEAKRIKTEHPVIYRGWMLNEQTYSVLEKKFINESNQTALWVNKDMYLSSHHLPQWYEALKDLTIPSVITTPQKAKEAMISQGWSQAFVKDYVKSLKTGEGSIAKNVEDLSRVFQDMITFRGNIEGGIVLREVKNVLPEMEKRYFILNDTVFFPDDTGFALDLVHAVRDKLMGTRLFYSVDVTQTREGENVVVEIGDAQVSDFVGWDIVRFTSIFDTLKYDMKQHKTKLNI